MRKTELFNLESQLPKDFRLLHTENLLKYNASRLHYIVFLIHLILQYDPQVLMPYLHHAATYCILMKYLFFWKHLKVVISQDNVLSLENRYPYSKQVYPNALLSWCYRQADAIITQTLYAKQDLVSTYHVSPNKITVIPNWRKDTRLYRFPKSYDLIYCGRFAPQKRLLRLLKIIKQLKKGFPHIKLCLIGDGPERNRLRHYIQNHHLTKHVFVKSPATNILAEVAKAKIFTLTSDFEGHPMILLEAMAQQVPAVVLRYPGSEEYLDHNHNGFIEDTTEAMVERIAALLRDDQKRETVGRAARQTVLEKHNTSLIDTTLSLVLQ